MTESENVSDGRYGKEYSRLRRLTSNLDVVQQSVCTKIHLYNFQDDMFREKTK